MSQSTNAGASVMLLRLLVIVSFILIAKSQYEESIGDLLIECNAYQSKVHFKNRTTHPCEKEDPDGDFRYFIEPMKTRYSNRDFLCVLFFKNEFSQLKFKLLFSHAQFAIDAVSKSKIIACSLITTFVDSTV